MLKILVLIFFTLAISSCSEIPHKITLESRQTRIKLKEVVSIRLEFLDDKRVWVEKILRRNNELIVGIGGNTDYLIEGNKIKIYLWEKKNENSDVESWLRKKHWVYYTWKFQNGILYLTSEKDGKCIAYKKYKFSLPDYTK